MTAGRRLALVTASAARDLDDDLAPLARALGAAGAAVDVVDWDDPSMDWSRYALTLLRSTWDYTQRLPEFLDWLARAAACTRLLNPFEVIRWSTDKHYLAALERAGVAVVPSVFAEPSDAAATILARFLDEHASSREFVIKPCVGAGSRDARRLGRDDHAHALAHLAGLLAGGRSAVLQPYLERVDADGETALIIVDGAFSHAIRKGPLLRRGDAPTRALFAAEHITARTPDAHELALGERAIAAIPFPGPPLLYARVDLIRDGAGAPRVLELELAEPSLFFATAAGSADRFAAAILRRLGD